jgi:hypothetical protein
MMIVPEIRTIVILVPRNASGTLQRTLKQKYEQAYLHYYHIEASGAPEDLVDWSMVGVVRHPLERLLTIYRGLLQLGERFPPFEEWLLTNDTVFGPDIRPISYMKYQIPETRKSQKYYLEPERGTEIFKFTQQPFLYARLGIDIPPEREWNNHNTQKLPLPELSQAGRDHMSEYFSWDMEQFDGPADI